MIASLQVENADLVVVSSGVLSLIGSSIIILSALIFKDLTEKFISLRLVVWLSVADFFASIFWIFGAAAHVETDIRDLSSDNTDYGCIIQAAGLQFFTLASFGWTASFAHCLYISTEPINPILLKQKMIRYQKIYHIFSWVPSLVIVIILLSMKMLGDAGFWCWITEQYSIYRFIFFYLPLWCVMIFNIVMYYLVVKNARSSTFILTRKAAAYLLVFLLTYSFGTANRIIDFVSKGELILWLALLQAFFNPLQGFLNCIVYGVSLPALRDKYKQALIGTEKESLNSGRGIRRNMMNSV